MGIAYRLRVEYWGNDGRSCLIQASRLSVLQTLKLGKTSGLSSRFLKNPLRNTRYTEKVLDDMKPKLKTGKTDFHGFPRIVDNYVRP